MKELSFSKQDYIKIIKNRISNGILFLCLIKPRCSKEIAKIKGKESDDRNISKVLNEMKRKGFLEVIEPEEREYPNSKYFLVPIDAIIRMFEIEFDFKCNKKEKEELTKVFEDSNARMVWYNSKPFERDKIEKTFFEWIISEYEKRYPAFKYHKYTLKVHQKLNEILSKKLVNKLKRRKLLRKK